MEDLVPDLVKINQYRTLTANVEFLERSAVTITEAYGLMKNMQFDDDLCAIEDYIKKTTIQLRLKNKKRTSKKNAILRHANRLYMSQNSGSFQTAL